MIEPGYATISAVMPVFNGRRFVAEAIESIYAQTILPDEVIIVDDGSTDETPLVLKQFEGRPGISLIRKPNGGEASARNVGIERATGDYIAFLDQDDLWRRDKLERQLAQFDTTWGMSFTAYELITARTSKVVTYDAWDPDPRIVLELLERSAAIKTCSTILVRRDALNLIGSFETVEPFGTDWLMELRFAAAGNAVGYLPEPLTQYRSHGGNTSGDEHGEFFDCACAVFDLYGVRRLRAWRRLLAASYAHDHGDHRRARQRVLEAALIRPFSIRPGWVRLLV